IFELGFANYGDQSFGPVEYWGDISGVVHVSGLVQKTTPWAFGEPVFRFEEGYRPKKDIIIPSICDQQFERLNVNRNGWLVNSRLVSTAGIDSWLSVNFSFPTF